MKMRENTNILIEPESATATLYNVVNTLTMLLSLGKSESFDPGVQQAHDHSLRGCIQAILFEVDRHIRPVEEELGE